MIYFYSNNGYIHNTGKQSIDWIKSYSSLQNFLGKHKTIQGMPMVLKKDGLINIAHPGENYIKINNSIGDKNGKNKDELFTFGTVRITLLYYNCKYKNSILYGFSNKNSNNLKNIKWNVLFGDCHCHNNGDYWDLIIPNTMDCSNTSSLYLAIILIQDGWNRRITVDQNKKLYAFDLTDPNVVYFSISKDDSADGHKNEYHSINICEYDPINGRKIRMIIAFEDRGGKISDYDYNDVILAVSSKFIDDTKCTNYKCLY